VDFEPNRRRKPRFTVPPQQPLAAPTAHTSSLPATPPWHFVVAGTRPNLKPAGRREPGSSMAHSLGRSNQGLARQAAAAGGQQLSCFQSNHESNWWTDPGRPWSEPAGILINAGATTPHVDPRVDALLAVSLPFVELAPQHIHAGAVRHTSTLAAWRWVVICGFEPTSSPPRPSTAGATTCAQLDDEADCEELKQSCWCQLSGVRVALVGLKPRRALAPAGLAIPLILRSITPTAAAGGCVWPPAADVLHLCRLPLRFGLGAVLSPWPRGAGAFRAAAGHVARRVRVCVLCAALQAPLLAKFG